MIEPLQRTLVEVEANTRQEPEHEDLDPRILSSVMVSSKLIQIPEDPLKDTHTRLMELMHSSAVKALLDAGGIFAKREGIPPQEALQQIVVCLKEIDELWSKVLLKEGVARLSSQFH